jgi:hypothetical protein
MNDVLLIPIVMLAVMKPDSNYVTTIKPYTDAAECIEDVPTLRAGWTEDYPEAVFWCADPIGRAVMLPEQNQGALTTSLRPKPRPDNLETKIGEE